MEPISEEEPPSSGGWFCCPESAGSPPAKNEATRAAPPSPATMDRGINNKSDGRPKISKKKSVYISAREVLGAKELAALKEFEDAARASMMVKGGDHNESVYFDALDASMGEDDHNLPYAPAQVADPRPRESISMTDPSSLLRVMKELKDPRVNVQCAGYPGNLTEEELAACQQLKAELEKRKKDVAHSGRTYADEVRIYDPVETEPYALCRFLRARRFEVDKVIEMEAESLDVFREAQRHDFFPDPNEALGAPVNVFLTQMPTLYSGCAKNGSPVSYALAANLSVEGIECLTELDRIEQYSWHSIVHKFKQEIARAQKKNPDVVRCEAIQIIDLKGLNSSTLNSRTLEALQKTIVVNKCFPEVLNSMVILNAPYFFSFFWRIIKAMIDPRTASKVNMFSNEQDGMNWMLERIDKNELLSDFGGDGDSFEAVLNKQNVGTSAKRQVVHRYEITQRTNSKLDFTLDFNETAKFKAYTRSIAGAEFELRQDGKTATKAEVKGSPDNKPFVVDLFADLELKGPGEFTIESHGKASTTDYFVVAGEIFDMH